MQRPIEKPMGWPPPIEANAIFRRFPLLKSFVVMLTADGRHNELAKPARTLKAINWGPV